MGEVLRALAVLVIVFGTAMVVGFLVARWRLRLRNRVVPGRASSAPLTWLASPLAPARLHRRLRCAVAVAHTADALPAAHELLADLDDHAAAVDAQLVVAARLRSVRVGTLRSLSRQVDGLEAVAQRLATAAVASQRLPALAGESAEPLDRMTERLDALEAARRELLALEVAGGLSRPETPVTPVRPAMATASPQPRPQPPSRR